MNDLRTRLIDCFKLVFPDRPESEIPSTSQASVPAWDSVAAITMMNVVEDEFGIQIDLDILADLDSFERVLAYLETEVRAA
jgi:acyl carrier protein